MRKSKMYLAPECHDSKSNHECEFCGHAFSTFDVASRIADDGTFDWLCPQCGVWIMDEDRAIVENNG